MRGNVCERFIEKSPMSVMGRGTWERVLGAEQLTAWLARTAQKPYPRTVLCATVYAVLSPVVLRITPAVRAASRAQEEPLGASRIALYHKLNGVETPTAAEWVR